MSYKQVLFPYVNICENIFAENDLSLEVEMSSTNKGFE